MIDDLIAIIIWLSLLKDALKRSEILWFAAKVGEPNYWSSLGAVDFNTGIPILTLITSVGRVPKNLQYRGLLKYLSLKGLAYVYPICYMVFAKYGPYKYTLPGTAGSLQEGREGNDRLTKCLDENSDNGVHEDITDRGRE